MAKYLFKNWETQPFKDISFEGQFDRYAKVCIVSVDNPETIVDIIPIYGKMDDIKGFKQIIQLIHYQEQGIPLDNESRRLLLSLQKPFEGGFEEIKSMHGSLFRQFTPDEAKYGLCPVNKVWKPERDENGKIKVYNTMKVFTRFTEIPDIGTRIYVNGWFPHQMYYKYFGYRYCPISQLREPLER